MFESIHGSPGAGFDCQCQQGLPGSTALPRLMVFFLW